MTAIYDCMVFVQALASNTGTSARCLKAVEEGDVTLIVSNATLLEVEDLLHRDSLRGSVILCNDATIRAFLDHIVAVAHKVNAVPMVWSLYRDPKDEKYVKLAIATNAEFIVTRDRLLLSLMTVNDVNAVAFRASYPSIEILSPEAFLARLP